MPAHLKILPPSFARDRQAVLRFRREVEAAGRLKHPNVVAAVDADEDRGVHFLVMEYVEGHDLDRVVRDRGPLPVPQAIDCIIQAARGLEAAHAQGIVHRDIKPGNLMLDSGGTVRVLDLGLARIVDAANPFGKAPGGRLTESGMYMGTVDFMAPEQAEDSRRADHRADIYALGCSLYYLLTGQTPFDGPTVLKRLMAHLEQPAPSLRSKRPEAPAKLEAVFQKMMAKRPDDRPASMTELICASGSLQVRSHRQGFIGHLGEAAARALGLQRGTRQAACHSRKRIAIPQPPHARRSAKDSRIPHDFNLEDLIIDVRSDPRPEPPLAAGKHTAGKSQPLSRAGQRSQVRRIPRSGNLIAAIAAFAVLAALFTWFILVRDHRGAATPEAALTQVGTDQSDVAGEKQLTETSGGTLARAPAFHDEFHTIFDGTGNRGWILCNKRPLPMAHVQKDGINPHGTGSYLVVYQEKLSDFELDFDYKLDRGCNSGVFLRVSDLEDPVHTGIEVSLDDTTGRGVIDSGAFYGLVAPEVNAQNPARQWNHMTITAQGPEINVVLNGSPVSSINLDEWTIPGKRPDGKAHSFKNVAISKLARTGYIGFQNLKGNCWFNQIRLKKLSPGGVSSPRSIAGNPAVAPQPVSAAAFEPLVETARFTGHTHPWVETVRVSPDGKTLLTTCGDGTARLWDIATGLERRRLWHPTGLRPAAFHPDGRRAVTGCSDGLVRLWDLETGRLIRSLAKHSRPVMAIAISPDGRYACSGGEDNTLRLLEIETGKEIHQFEGATSPIWSAAISPDGQHIVAGTAGGTILVGDTNSRESLRALSGHTQTVWELAFFADSHHFASAGRDGLIMFWALNGPSAVSHVNVDDASIRSLAIAPEGRTVVFASQHPQSGEQGSLGIWDVTTNQPTRLSRQRFAHLGLALLPQGGIATADDDGIARIWEPAAAVDQARKLKTAGSRPEALLQYDNALANRRDDARLLIERGRLLAQLGESSKADADFHAAARLAPENPQLFLDAGWWVAGPYPTGFDRGGALESSPAPDPSKPAPSLGNEARRWFEITTGRSGAVTISDLYKVDRRFAYAMTIIYSSRQCEMAVLIGTDDAARIWNNGKQVFFSPTHNPPLSRTLLMMLKPGRNTILAKVTNEGGPHSLNMHFGTAPADTARAYADAGKWKEAADEFTKAFNLDPDSSDGAMLESFAESLIHLKRWKEATPIFEKIAAFEPGNFAKQRNLMECYLVTKDYDAFRRLCESGIVWYRKNQTSNLANEIIWPAAVIPKAVAHYGEVIDIGRKMAGSRSAVADHWNTFGAVLYRAGQYPSSLTFLKKSIDAQKGKGNAYDWVFTAMARHRSRQPGAQAALARAKELAKDSGISWQVRIELDALLEEAEQELKLPVPH